MQPTEKTFRLLAWSSDEDRLRRIQDAAELSSSDVDRAGSLAEVLSRLEADSYDAIIVEEEGATADEVSRAAPLTPVLSLADLGSADAGTLDRLIRERLGDHRDLVRARRENERLIRTISHDLRSPIVKMAMFSDLLLRRFGNSLGPERSAELHAFRSAQNEVANQLADLVVERRRIRTAAEPFGPGPLSDELDRLAEERGVMFDAVPRMVERLEPVRADFPRLYDAGRGIHPKADEYLDIMRRADSLLGRYLEVFTAFDRLEKEDRPLVATDLGAAAREAARELEGDFAREGGEIAIARLPIVLGLPDLLARIFGHLFENALRYRSPERPPRARVRGKVEGASAVAVVEDQGGGIPPDVVDEVFDPFFTTVTTQDHERLGVGLAFCRRVAQIHGGRIEVESTSAEGTAFRIELPSGS